jgi:hypothetical protein
MGSAVAVLTAFIYAGAAAVSLALARFVPRSGRALTRAAVSRLLAIALFGAALAPTLLV